MVKAKVEDETTHQALHRQFADIDEWAKAEGLPRNPDIALTRVELDANYGRSVFAPTQHGLTRWQKWVEKNVKER